MSNLETSHGHVCPLCSNMGGVARSVDFDTDIRTFACPRCGRFRITEKAEEDLSLPRLKPRRYLLSGVTRGASEAGRTIEIGSTEIDHLIDLARRPRTVLEAMDRVLSHMGDRSGAFGESVHLTSNDYPIVFGRDGSELAFLINSLVESGYVDSEGDGMYRLTLQGWNRLEQSRQVKAHTTQAFVAMWFTVETEGVWREGFKPALETVGFTPVRVDQLPHNDKICDRIIVEIRRSAVLIADFTGNRGGVYFEAGFAFGLGMPVVWCCRRDFVDQLHFDTRQYNHILWTDAGDLRTKLVDRLVATVAVPQPDFTGTPEQR